MPFKLADGVQNMWSCEWNSLDNERLLVEQMNCNDTNMFYHNVR